MSLLDDASLLVTPNAEKEGKLYSIIPTNGNGDFSVTRATTATRVNAAGLVELVPYNLLQQSEVFSNAIWTKLAASITANITTAPNGTLTADKLVEDTANASHQTFQSVSNLNTSTNYTLSVYLKAAERFRFRARVTGYSGANDVSIDLNTQTTIGGGTLTSVGDGWFRFTYTINTGTGAGFPLVSITLQDNSGNNTYLGNGTSGAFVWGAQLVEGTSALDYQMTETRLNIPRLDYSLGSCPNILLEPQRTNSIRNSTMVGASVPSTLPTNWVRQNTSGLTQTIVGVGTENGVNYVDINLQGIATSQNDAYSFDQTISASIGQTWTSSWYFKLVTSTPNAVRLAMQEFNGATFLNVVTQDITPTTTLARYAQTKTLVGTGVTNVRAMIYVNFVIGQTYNTTIRLAAPQMEQGAYATSYIPTTSASVTRNADVISRGNIFTNGLITASGGTWFVDLRNNLQLTNAGTDRGLLLNQLNTGTANGLAIRRFNANVRLQITKVLGGSSTLLYTTTTDTSKIAIKWNGTTADIFVNGVKVVAATAFAYTAMEFLATRAGEETTQNINSMALFPTPLTDTQCIAITS
jgi:hypothetical protein